MPKPDKAAILAACIAKIEAQIKHLKISICSLQESVNGEEKSSAGDKYETARAMGHHQLEMMTKQIPGLEKDLSLLNRINPSLTYNRVKIGSLVQTDKKLMFIAVGLGKISIDQDIVFAISPASPIGKLLMDKEKSEILEYAGNKEIITNIC